MKLLKHNKKSFIRTLFDIVSSDVKTLTGSNVRKILLDTGLDPCQEVKRKLSTWRVYPSVDTWTVPLLSSLLELRADNWQVTFDVEEEGETLAEEEIEFMITAVCTG